MHVDRWLPRVAEHSSSELRVLVGVPRGVLACHLYQAGVLIRGRFAYPTTSRGGVGRDAFFKAEMLFSLSEGVLALTGCIESPLLGRSDSCGMGGADTSSLTGCPRWGKLSDQRESSAVGHQQRDFLGKRIAIDFTKQKKIPRTPLTSQTSPDGNFWFCSFVFFGTDEIALIQVDILTS